MFVELSVVLKTNGPCLVAGTQVPCAQPQGRGWLGPCSQALQKDS